MQKQWLEHFCKYRHICEFLGSEGKEKEEIKEYLMQELRLPEATARYQMTRALEDEDGIVKSFGWKFYLDEEKFKAVIEDLRSIYPIRLKPYPYPPKEETEASYNIPVWEKYTLSIEEAAAYFRIGEHKLRNLINENKNADYLLWNGNRVQIKRVKRDYIEAGNYIETIFPFLGVRFISINDHFDTETEFNQNKSLEIALKNLVNDMYAKDISKRVAVSRRLDMERGKFTGSNAPYGYKVDSTDSLRKYIVDEEAAAVVRQIFELAAEGVTLREIAKALQNYRLALPGEYLKSGKLYVEEGQEAKAWYVGTISNILKNQAYIGNMVQGKRRTRLSENEARHFTEEEDWIVVENIHEPIVDKELFDKVREVLGQKVEESSFASERGKNLPVKDDIFAGILFCGNCKKRLPQLSRIIEKDGRLERQYFYACRYNYDFGGEKCGCTILEQELVRAVHKILEVNIATLTESEKTEAVVKCVMDKNLKQCDGQIRKLEKLIEKQNYEESKAYQRYVTGEVSKEDFKRMQEKSADAVMRLRGQISDEQAKYRRFKRFFEKKLQWLRAIYRFQSEPYLDRNILEILVHSIYLYPDSRMEINLNFKDEYAEMMKEEA